MLALPPLLPYGPRPIIGRGPAPELIGGGAIGGGVDAGGGCMGGGLFTGAGTLVGGRFVFNGAKEGLGAFGLYGC